MVLWIFGYGSLIWTPNFRYEECVTGYIKDFTRIFAVAGSADHRRSGTAGLGLTLQPQEGAVTEGVAYRVTDDVEHQILSSNLGTSRVIMLEVFTAKGASDSAATIRAMTYITPPEKSNLWHIVLQLSPVVTTVNHSDRESADSDRPTILMSKTEDRWLSAPRVSINGSWKWNRAWFEFHFNRVTN